jgi:hypothetical protein
MHIAVLGLREHAAIELELSQFAVQVQAGIRETSARGARARHGGLAACRAVGDG